MAKEDVDTVIIKKAKDNPSATVGKKEHTILEASPKNRKKSKLSRRAFKRIQCKLKIKAVMDNGLSIKKCALTKQDSGTLLKTHFIPHCHILSPF